MRRVTGDSNSCTTRARRIGSQVEFTIFPLAMLCTSPEVRRDSRCYGTTSSSTMWESMIRGDLRRPCARVHKSGERNIRWRVHHKPSKVFI
ncbi:hypothetical protein Taro_053478 [Colocasia esculenta]|uniref:Uncharacterized protein n=1 Tax=Colocasia esculenta TaxID=4460 RepID=A0A843XM98_COLES|nr:hypothetical protein [Colocasia esculenta]